MIIVEWIKYLKEELKNTLTRFNYAHFEMGVNLLAIHNSDPTLGDVKFHVGGGYLTPGMLHHGRQPQRGRALINCHQHRYRPSFWGR